MSLRNSGYISRVIGTSALVLVKLLLRTCVMKVIGGRTLMVERSRVSFPPAAGDEGDRARAEFVVHAHRERRALLTPFRDPQRLRGRFHDLQMLRALRADLHLRVFAGAFDVVRDSHAHFEFIAGRGQDRHARRDDKRPANQRIAVPPRRSRRPPPPPP